MDEWTSLLSRSVTQDNRLLYFKNPLSEHLLAHRVHAQEEVGLPGVFTVELLSHNGQLNDAGLIGKPVALGIGLANGQQAWRHGIAQALRYLGADGGWHCWHIEFTSWLALLTYREDCRIWMDRSILQVFEAIFAAYPEAEGRFRFDMRNDYPSHSYITQFNETDFDFVRRWMEHYGVFCYVEHQEDQHTVVFTDDVDTISEGLQPNIRFHTQDATQKEDSLLYWQPLQQLHSGRITYAGRDYLRHRQPVQAQDNALSQMTSAAELERYRYRGQYAWASPSQGQQQVRTHMEAQESAAQRVYAVSGVRGLSVGTTFMLHDHPQVKGREPHIVLTLETFAESNLPMAIACRDMPGSLGPIIREARRQVLPDTEEGDADKASSATYGHYLNRLTCQPAKQAFRLDIVTPTPTIGIQTATVTAPPDHEVYTDPLNRVRVRFNWDRHQQDSDATSCWLRMMQPSSGNGWGHVNVPRAGEEVLVGFLDNDVDRPLILGQVYGEDKPAWHSHGLMSGYRSKEIRGRGYNQLLMDDATGQLRTQLASSSADTQLNLGELIDQEGNTRGSLRGRGFELRTAAYGALRASKGLYLSSWGQPAGGDQLEAQGVWQTLAQGQELNNTLSTTATQHQATALTSGSSLQQLNRNAQSRYRHAENANTTASQRHSDGGGDGDTHYAVEHGAQGETAGLDDALVVIASPDGIATVTPRHTHLHSGEQLNIAAGDDINIAGGKGLLANLADRFALFVHKAGIKLVAARGKITLQAQSDELVLDADKTLRITSTKEGVIVAAKKEILLTSGDAYIRIADGDIQIHAPKTISIKGAQKTFSGGASMAQTFNDRPTTAFERKIVVRQHNGEPARNIPYEITREGGGIVRGVTDDQGNVALQKSDVLEKLQIKLLRGSK